MEPYTGRLAYDPETDFHLSEDGKPVVTDDGGRTWRYATNDDFSHFAKYHERYAVVDSTANAAEPEPHHFEVQPDDPHFNGMTYVPDVKSATNTSHTDAWKDANE